MYEKILKWFRFGLWTESMVQNAVDKGVLTATEAETITQGGKTSDEC